MAYPSVKNVVTNNWAEENGIEADLSELFVDSRDVTMTFAVGSGHDFREFFSWLKSLGTFTLKAREIGSMSFRLRLKSHSALEIFDNLQKFSVVLSEDNPWELVGDYSPSSTIDGSRNFRLDDVSLTDYNIRVLKGTQKSVITQAELKDFLIRASAYRNGRTYDENPFDRYTGSGEWEQSSTDHATPKDKSREFVVQCLLTAPDINTFWANYVAFFKRLIRKESASLLEDITTACRREFRFIPYDRKFKCYYKSQTLSQFFPDNDRVWAQFAVTMCALDGNGEEVGRLLNTEASDWVITENGLYVML